MRAVFCRELAGYFTTPVGYLFLAMYALLSGVVFVFVNIAREMSASMNLLFSGMQLPFLLIAPLLTMRLFAEERRARTDQLWLTAPVRVGRVVAGKLGAALVMLALSMALTLLYPLAVSPWAQVSARQVAAVWLGYYLLGASMIAVGALVSALCENPVSAAVFTLGFNILAYLSERYILPQTGAAVPGALRAALSWLPSSARLGDFANGVISLADCAYFLSVTALAAFLTCRVIERRRFAKG